MYLSHFSLKEAPFGITPDTSYFMNRAGYQDALNVLLVALRSGEGFIKVIAEVGVGKTILCRKLLRMLKSDCVIAYIHNPYLQPDTLLYAIADSLAIKYEDNASQHVLHKSITKKLIEYHRQGKKVVLCMDEVQAMPVQTLETLRLLTNLETEKRKLLQVVLFGQPELDEVLNQPAIRQLKQRITFSYRLLPLNKVALTSYIRHRLTIAGCTKKDLFSVQAVDYLHHASGGIPRLVNILCHKAMMLSYGEGGDDIKLKHLRLAAKDTMETQDIKRSAFDFWLPSFGKWIFGSLCVAFVMITIRLGMLPGEIW
ncbi:MAG: AAA family ATPase [Gammaproteobacteria bacterium]|jgi:MSHA biogenesis protein MshM|nr:AAA family ATPase [Gammaproteobacteria bacterium]